jgi:hypothetical protein
LRDRQLSAMYKIQGYLALQATATAWRADAKNISIPNLLPSRDSNPNKQIQILLSYH